tara:strand:+ start:279 stop:446 length:168 start_codon:yes stop_codon:yes gene_type:complete
MSLFPLNSFARLWVRNLEDKTVESSAGLQAAPLSGLVNGGLKEPRTYGLEVGLNF